MALFMQSPAPIIIQPPAYAPPPPPPAFQYSTRQSSSGRATLQRIHIPLGSRSRSPPSVAPAIDRVSLLQLECVPAMTYNISARRIGVCAARRHSMVRSASQGNIGTPRKQGGVLSTVLTTFCSPSALSWLLSIPLWLSPHRDATRRWRKSFLPAIFSRASTHSFVHHLGSHSSQPTRQRSAVATSAIGNVVHHAGSAATYTAFTTVFSILAPPCVRWPVRLPDVPE